MSVRFRLDRRLAFVFAGFVLAAFVFAAFMLVARTGVPTVALQKLAAEQEDFAGDTLRTSGVVREFTDSDGTRYYVLEDADANRVQLLPATAVARYEGDVVTVVGIFDVRPAVGRVLEVQAVDRTPP